MIPIFAKFMLGEKIFIVDVIGIALGFIGMLFTALPFTDFKSLFDAIAGSDMVEVKTAMDTQQFIYDTIGVALAFIGAIFSTLSLIYLKKIANKVKPEVAGVYVSATNVILSGVLGFFIRRPVIPIYSV